jgi:hypothetical protein
MQQPQQPQTSRPDQFATYAPVSAPSNSRMTLPPTPPMHPDVAHDGNQSPSATSNHSASGPYFIGGSLNNMEPHQQRQSFSSMPSLKRDSIASHSMSPYSTSIYGQSPYLFHLVLLARAALVQQYCYVRTASAPLQLPATRDATACTCTKPGCEQLQPMATSSLHQYLKSVAVSTISGPLHLLDLQQGLLPTQQPADTQPQSHGREAVQVPAAWLWQSLQCPQQHEATRARLPRGCQHYYDDIMHQTYS